ncbi:MAG TPA: lycopene cyclase domain-containing protein [Bacteroidia bacterium]|jgi:lycopene cyclase domain-containing protein
MHYTYILLLAFTLSYPLFKSFEKKVNYVSKWKHLLPALVFSASIFIAWDVWFTSIGIWQFNAQYVIGVFIAGLPIEEWLFFLIVPFSCVFIYEVMNYFVKKDILASYSKFISTLLILSLIAIGALYFERIYTSITFISLGVFLFIHQFILKSPYLGRFYLAWTVCLIPFTIVNGVLTAMPVLIYNNLYNLNIRIYTIPLEDVFYGMLNILLVITIYEYCKLRKS